MSKPTIEERIFEIEIQIKLNKNYRVQYTYEVSDGVIALLDARLAKLEKERAALLSPAPKKPRKQKAIPALPKLPLPVDTASSEPIARYEPSGEYVNVNAKRGRNG